MVDSIRFLYAASWICVSVTCRVDGSWTAAHKWCSVDRQYSAGDCAGDCIVDGSSKIDPKYG